MLLEEIRQIFDTSKSLHFDKYDSSLFPSLEKAAQFAVNKFRENKQMKIYIVSQKIINNNSRPQFDGKPRLLCVNSMSHPTVSGITEHISQARQDERQTLQAQPIISFLYIVYTEKNAKI